ncbi:helix-turn-helix domain-containing protein [Chitinophaga sp. GCM10012297]|uniref:Helix-turn-helix domain-containing protein n=1 Tax=Chitinophaga chungangae TaxID=2821488 RepID=A0ABS3YC03_9BACT|nr:AraC family transcriptional regulator [Chitinophaga chungangae]MBO9151990.1 helix-turn-helix domain-containing protein [Chitinophaga chungangae]
MNDLQLEEIHPDSGRSFKFNTSCFKKNFYWHFHPEYEIVYVEGGSGTRHVGQHISNYIDSDLIFIGPDVPHLNFDYGLGYEINQIVVQLKEDFLGDAFLNAPEMSAIRELFNRAKYGLSFSGQTKTHIAAKLKQMQEMDHFAQLISLLEVFQLMATSKDVVQLNQRADQQHKDARMAVIYGYIDANFHLRPDVNTIARQVHMTTAAFCRYFKKQTGMTFTDFVNHCRINQAKNLLLQDRSVSEACFATGFEQLSYFTKLFTKMNGENPREFKKRHLANA